MLLTALFKRISSETLWTEADGISVIILAGCIHSARIWKARIVPSTIASNLWISFQSRWTSTFRLMIFGVTFSIVSANIVRTWINATSIETITECMRRAIFVVLTNISIHFDWKGERVSCSESKVKNDEINFLSALTGKKFLYLKMKNWWHSPKAQAANPFPWYPCSQTQSVPWLELTQTAWAAHGFLIWHGSWQIRPTQVSVRGQSLLLVQPTKERVRKSPYNPEMLCMNIENSKNSHCIGV